MGRRRLVACALVVGAALLFSGQIAAAPRGGLFVPGKSLGGARLGMTKAEILRLWGRRHGVCRSCDRTTWYFNEQRFEPQGVGVAFGRGRAVALFTVWRPDGWRTPKGLALGDSGARVTAAYGPLLREVCAGYEALVRRTAGAQSAFYIDGASVWGFGLMAPGISPCLS
jgi:hypothetical protein